MAAPEFEKARRNLRPTPPIEERPTESELRASRTINACLDELDRQIDAFAAGLMLCDFANSKETEVSRAIDSLYEQVRGSAISVDWAAVHSLQEERKKYHAWRAIAGRDGAMSIFHFAKAMEGASKFHETPILKKRIDKESLRMVKKLFKSKFPLFEAMRNAVAHIAELHWTPDKRDKNSVRGPFSHKGIVSTSEHGVVIVQNSFFEGEFTFSFLGRFVSYPLTEETLNQLRDIRDRFRACFP